MSCARLLFKNQDYLHRPSTTPHPKLDHTQAKFDLTDAKNDRKCPATMSPEPGYGQAHGALQESKIVRTSALPINHTAFKLDQTQAKFDLTNAKID